MSLSDLNAIQLNADDRLDENSPLKLVRNPTDSTAPSSPELKLVSNIDEEKQEALEFEKAGGVSALLTQAFYGNITAGHVPEWIKEAIEAQANRLQQTPDGGFSKGMGGSLGKKTKEEEAEENSQKAAEWFEDHMDRVEQEQKKLEEWRAKSIDVGNGVKMTGEEIETVLELLGTREGKQKFLDAFKKKTGANDDKANKAFNDYERYLQLLKAREIGRDLSTEDQKFLKDFPKTEDGKHTIQLGERLSKYSTELSQQSDNVSKVAAITPVSYSREAGPTITPKFNENATANINSSEIKILAELKQDNIPASKPSESLGIDFG